jgi:hypothetical protein
MSIGRGTDYAKQVSAFWDILKYRNIPQIVRILENVVYTMIRINMTFQEGLGRTTQTLYHVVVVHILIRDNGKSQINEYSYISVMFYVVNDENPI